MQSIVQEIKQRFKVGDILSKHFNQSFVIGQTCLRTKGKEWQTQRRKMLVYLWNG